MLSSSSPLSPLSLSLLCLCISNVITFNYAVLTFRTVVVASSSTYINFDQIARAFSFSFCFSMYFQTNCIRVCAHEQILCDILQYSSSLFTFNTEFIICNWKCLLTIQINVLLLLFKNRWTVLVLNLFVIALNLISTDHATDESCVCCFISLVIEWVLFGSNMKFWMV